MDKRYYVYILASRSRNLYIGVTNNLLRRIVEHRLGLLPGFTSRYKIFRLVHYEVFGDVRLAIAREKEIKSWRREKKEWLVKKHNPTWVDRAADWFGKNPPRAITKAKADPSLPSKIRPGSG